MPKKPSEICVFVVDNEPIIASTVAMVLRSQGFVATSFTAPLEALTAAPAQMPDLLLADMVMPELSGSELAVRLLETCPDCKILLFSGLVNPHDHLGTPSAGGRTFEYLSKPADPPTLLRRIQKILDLSEPDPVPAA